MATRLIEPERKSAAITLDVRDPVSTVSHVQWGAILAGSLAGFAVAVLMTTLGTAIGMTASAAMADQPMTEAESGTVAWGFGIGAVIWFLVTAIVAGLVGGGVLNRTARHDRPYLPGAFGFLTWAGGLCIALVAASIGAPGLAGAMGRETGRAAEVGAAVAWVALGTQLVSLTCTLLAARWRQARGYAWGAPPAP